MKSKLLQLIILCIGLITHTVFAQLPVNSYNDIPDDWDSLMFNKKTTSITDISMMSIPYIDPYSMWKALPDINYIPGYNPLVDYFVYPEPYAAFKAGFDMENLYIVLQILDDDFVGSEAIHIGWAPYSNYFHAIYDTASSIKSKKDATAWWNHKGAYYTTWNMDNKITYVDAGSMWNNTKWQRIRRTPASYSTPADSLHLSQHKRWVNDTLYVLCKIPFSTAMHGFSPYGPDGSLIQYYPFPKPRIALEVAYVNHSTMTDEIITYYWNSLSGAVNSSMYFAGIGSFGKDTIIPPPQDEYSIRVPDVSSGTEQKSVVLPIKTSEISAEDNIISYQFHLRYDPSFVQYGMHNINGTLSADGQLAVNDQSPGLLKVSFMSSKPLSGKGDLIKFQFWPVGIAGTSHVKVYNFKFNTTDVTFIKQGSITISDILKGDVDFDGKVLAFDAAISLQYAVGLDPIPNIDPIPWKPERIVAADMDGNGWISGWDATLILRKSIGLDPWPVLPCWNDTFPSYSLMPILCYDINTYVDKDYIYFESIGDVYSFDIVNTTLYDVELKEPEIMANVYSAIRQENKKMAVAISSANPIASYNHLLIKIPYSGYGKVNFEVLVNNTLKYIELDLSTIIGPTGYDNLNEKDQLIYPNPAVDRIYFNDSNIDNITIYSTSGRLVLTEQEPANYLNISLLEPGIYVVKLKSDNRIITERFYKK